jgi:hypothetical protein
MKKIIALTIAATSLAGCVYDKKWDTTPYPTASYALTEGETQALTAEVRSRLKDPDSAMFRDVRAVRKGDSPARVCGYVNSRNAFGGYVGFVPFVALQTGPNNFEVPAIGDDSFGLSEVQLRCREYGIPLT